MVKNTKIASNLFNKKPIFVGIFVFILLFSNFSILLNDFKGVNTEQLSNNEIKTENVPLISDNFESYVNNAALWAVWSRYAANNCNVTISTDRGYNSAKSVKFVDNNLTNWAYMCKTFPANYKFIYVSVWVYPTETNEQFRINIDNSSYYALSVGFHQTGQFLYTSGASETTFTVLTYTASTWYHFEILYDVQSHWYSAYANNMVICERVPTITNWYSMNRLFLHTGVTQGAGSAVFYVDDITVRDWSIKNQGNITAIRQDDFERYGNNDQLATGGWTLNAGKNTNATLQANPFNSHSYQKSICLYDNNNTWNGLCDLRCSYSGQSFIYLRSYVLPAQRNGVLWFDILNATGCGTYFAFWYDGFFHYWTSPTTDINTNVAYVANRWYKIEIFASQTTTSVRVNDTWVVQNLGNAYSLNSPFTGLIYCTDHLQGTIPYRFYVDDIFLANQSDEISSGKPLNAFNEKLLLDNDANSQIIQSVDVSGQQTVVSDYQYNFSEYTSASVKNITWNYGFSSIVGVQIRSIVRLYNNSDSTWNIILNTTSEGTQSLGGCLFEGVSDYLNSESILLARLEVIRLASSSVFDFSLNQLRFRWNLNKIINILSPENTTYRESTSGYYPATYGFDNVPDGQDDPAWVDSGISSITSSWYGHNKVYQCPSGRLLGLQNVFSAPQPNGTVEFYMNEELANYGFQGRLFGQKPADTIVVNWRFYANQFWSTNLSQFIAFGKPLVNNVWYHVRIDFETTSGNYLGLAPWTYRIYLDGEAFGPFKFMENLTPTFLHFYCMSQPNRRNIDAVGYSWDPNYRIGDNLRGGLLLNFTSEITLDKKWYSLDGQPIKPLLGITPIPLNPSGTHSLQIYANDTIGNLYESEVRYFAVDVSPPTYATVLESADPLELGATETITITGVADLSRINQTLLAFGGVNHTMTDLGEGTWRYNKWIPTSIGTFSYSIFIQDNVGHWNATNGAIQVLDSPSDPRQDEWPMFRGQLNHTGEAYTTPTIYTSLFWTSTIGGRIMWSSSAVVGGRVYVGCDDNKIYCLNATTGQHLWDYATGAFVLSSPAVAARRIYIGSLDTRIYCLNTTTGQQLWNYTTGNAVFSSPAVAGGYVYIGSWDGKVCCLNVITGQNLWNYTTGSAVWSSPAVMGGYVYVGSDDSKVYCLNATTGQHLWNYTTGGNVRSSPAVVGGRVYIGSFDYKVYCLNATTGQHLWNYTTGDLVDSSPAIAGGCVYVGSGNKIYCLNAITGQHLWNYISGSSVRSSPAVAGGCVYIASQDARIYCLNATTGQQLWNYTTGDLVDSSPAIAGGCVYVGSHDRNIYCLPCILDTTPPTYTSVMESNDPLEFGGTEIIGISGVSDLNGINQTLFAFDGTNHTMNNLGGNIWIYIWTPSNLGVNPYTIYLQDNADLWTTIAGTIQVVDTTPPTYGSLIESADPLGLGETETITITDVRDLSGIPLLLIEFEGTNHTMTNLGDGTWDYNVWAPNTIGDYPYTIYIQDNGENWNSTSGTITVVPTPPVPVLMQIQPRVDTDGVIQLNWSEGLYVNRYYIYQSAAPISDISGLTPINVTMAHNYTATLNINGLYYWVIVAGNDWANSSISNCENVIVAIPLGAPTLYPITLDSNNNGIIYLSWEMVEDATIYYVYRATSVINSIIGRTPIAYITWPTYFMDIIPLNTTYYYVVVAGDGWANSSISNCESILVPIPPVSPTLPPNSPMLNPIYPATDTDGIIYLDWNDVSNATASYIYRATSNITTVALLTPVAIISGNSYFVDLLEVSDTYYYVIVAGNAWGNSSLSNCECVEVSLPPPPPTTAPNAPMVNPVFPGTDSDGIIYLDWNDVSGANSYFIYRATSNITSVASLTPLAIVSANSYFIDCVSISGTYYYVVVAGNSWGNSSLSACRSIVVSFAQEEPSPPDSTVPAIIIGGIAIAAALIVQGLLRRSKPVSAPSIPPKQASSEGKQSKEL